jgi:hypothetical protein
MPVSLWNHKETKGPKPPAKASCRQAKKTANEDGEDPPGDANCSGPCILWDAPRTDRLIEWLENNVEDHQRLFSDSAKDAKKQKCRVQTAKNTKTGFHLKMAEYIFSVDDDVRVRDDLKAHGPKKYVKTVENRITK